MKAGRLLAYAAAGVIAGLLMENNVLHLKQKAGSKARKLKRSADRKIAQLKEHKLN